MTRDAYAITRTADVLNAIGEQPTTSRELCATLNRTADQVAGHLTSLIRQGKITRVSRGVYRRGA